MSGASVFVAGEVLEFEGQGFNHYDDCFDYWFHSQNDGQTKTWSLRGDQSVGIWRELFEVA
ncbi:MAG: hypothetical protein WCP68_16230 [Enhydrobacter sp.]